MKAAKVLTLAAIALAIAGCERQPRSRANKTADAPPPLSQPSMPSSTAPGSSSAPQVTTGPGGLRIDTQGLIQECLNPADINRPLSEFSPEQRRALVVCGNRAAARQASSQMPLRVDALTTVTSIVAEDTTVIYNVRLDVDASTLPPGTVQRLEAGARSNACARADMRQTMAMGGAYAYVWTDRTGRQILSLRIDGC
jgi:hypothetical protein